jgi:hypothetical protein
MPFVRGDPSVGVSGFCDNMRTASAFWYSALTRRRNGILSFARNCTRPPPSVPRTRKKDETNIRHGHSLFKPLMLAERLGVRPFRWVLMETLR